MSGKIFAFDRMISILIFNDFKNEISDPIYMELIDNYNQVSFDNFMKYTKCSVKGTFFYEPDNEWLFKFYYLFYIDKLHDLDTFGKIPIKISSGPYFIESAKLFNKTFKKYNVKEYQLNILNNVNLNNFITRGNIKKIIEYYDSLMLIILIYLYHNNRSLYNYTVDLIITYFRYTDFYEYICYEFYS